LPPAYRHPDAYENTFASAVHALVKREVEAGKTARVTPLEDAPEAESRSNVVDLTELLAKSLAGRSGANTDRNDTLPSKPAARANRKKA
jgi:DNA end-binding protein Ku